MIPHYIAFKHIKGRDNILANSLSRLKTLGIYEANGCEEPGGDYGKSIFDTDSDVIFAVDIRQHSNKEICNQRY